MTEKEAGDIKRKAKDDADIIANAPDVTITEPDWKAAAHLAYGILKTKCLDKKLVEPGELKELRMLFNPVLIIPRGRDDE